MAGGNEDESSDPKLEEPMTLEEMEVAAAAAQAWVAQVGVVGGNA